MTFVKDATKQNDAEYNYTCQACHNVIYIKRASWGKFLTYFFNNSYAGNCDCSVWHSNIANSDASELENDICAQCKKSE